MQSPEHIIWIYDTVMAILKIMEYRYVSLTIW